MPPADDDEPSALEDAFIEFRDAGLRLPPIPREVLEELDEYSEWVWGSEPFGLDDVPGFLERARDPKGEPLVAFGQTGHGLNSWWLCYLAVMPGLAVYLRRTYGGAYGDREAEAAGFNEAEGLVEDLMAAVEAARGEERLPAGARLVVVQDERGGGGFELAGGSAPWRETEEALHAAIAFCDAAVAQG